MLRYTNKNSSKNSSKNSNNNNRNDQVKIYFPSISIQVLQHALHGNPNSSNKQKQTQTQTQTQNQKIPITTKLDKYLCSENQKTIMYGTTCILEILNNEPYNVYPSDKMILTSSVSSLGNGNGNGNGGKQNNIQLLIDYSNMKRSHTPSYQIPYDFKVHSCLVKKYKINPKSNNSFVVEYKDNKVYDFYILARLSGLPGLPGSGNRIELDNFVKEDVISFLLMLNLY
jgi:hypothetical protein